MSPGSELRQSEPRVTPAQPWALTQTVPLWIPATCPYSSQQEVAGFSEKQKEPVAQDHPRDDALCMLFPLEELSALKSALLEAPAQARQVRVKKRYRTVRNKTTGKVALLHRQVAAAMLGRPLSPAEIVHHRDGDSTNNDCDNLLVLPSQAYHAHIEYHLRCEKRGMPSLFPELFQEVKTQRQGTLFDYLLLKG